MDGKNFLLENMVHYTDYVCITESMHFFDTKNSRTK